MIIIKLKNKIKEFNDIFAEKATKYFQTMGMFYIFCIYGLLPLIKIFHPYQDQFLYYSNYVQLISLPLLAVGQYVSDKTSAERLKITNESAEKRSKEMYDMIKTELQIVKDEQISAKEDRDNLKEILETLKEDQITEQNQNEKLAEIIKDNIEISHEVRMLVEQANSNMDNKINN